MGNTTLRLLGYQRIEGEILCMSGLHIGAGGEASTIMELDNPIIKDPVSKLPYIPGSSLKGKLRSLLELSLGKIGENGGVHKCKDEDCEVCRIFGVAGDTETTFGPGRLIVRDAMLAPKSEVSTETDVNEHLRTHQKMEVKWENTINRVSGTAEHPRQMERVPVDARFTFFFDYRIFDTGDGGEADKRHFEHILKAMKLLEKDYLGGSGSRGYGRISFGTVTVTDMNGLTEEITISTWAEA